MTLDDTLAAIDAATSSCAQCNGPRGDSPSADFCSEACQRRWLQTCASHPEQVLGPDANSDVDSVYLIARAARRAWSMQVTPMVEAFNEAMAGLSESVRRIGEAISSSSPQESAKETPRQRALRLQQNRNTGPRRDPHAKRGRS